MVIDIFSQGKPGRLPGKEMGLEKETASEHGCLWAPN